MSNRLSNTELVLEVNKAAKLKEPIIAGGMILITPPLDGDFWLFRVAVSSSQAVVEFPKFMIMGIGFQHEEDWNTNLPYTCEADEIFRHIAHNKGDESITDEKCIKAIQMLKDAVCKYWRR